MTNINVDIKFSAHAAYWLFLWFTNSDYSFGVLQLVFVHVYTTECTRLCWILEYNKFSGIKSWKRQNDENNLITHQEEHFDILHTNGKFVTRLTCHCVVCSSSIYGFWLSLWYLQTFLKIICNIVFVVVLENDFFDPGIPCSSYSISHEIRVDKGIYRYICSRNITYCVVAKMFMFISTSLMMHGKNISQWHI
jgi:hypothetical protein